MYNRIEKKDHYTDTVNPPLGIQVLSSSGPGQVPGQVQKVRVLRTKDLDLG
mgnify:CR=1 FL=1